MVTALAAWISWRSLATENCQAIYSPCLIKTLSMLFFCYFHQLGTTKPICNLHNRICIFENQVKLNYIIKTFYPGIKVGLNLVVIIFARK